MSYNFDYQPATKNKFWNLGNQRTTGIVMHSIGCPQPKAQVLVNNFNKAAVTQSVHGFIEPNLYIETAPTRVSKNMAKKCYHVGGSWNNSRIGLEMCEPSTIVYTGGSAFQDKDPENTKKYIRDCTATAAEVVADICIFHGFSVDMISTHAEAYRLGFGSNHGDPDHIWKYIGYSVAQFRKDVQTIINEKGDYTGKMNKAEFEQILDAKFAEFEKKIPAAKADEVVYKFFENVPTWAQPAIKKALDKKYLNGVGTENNKPILNLSADMVRIIVVLNNAGIWDK